MSANEFSRAIRLDTLGTASRDVTFTAEPAEREALARRFGLLSLDRLAVTAAMRRDAGGVFAEGRVSGAVVQACVATGEPVPATVDEPFALRFVPEDDVGSAEEIELSAGDCDVVPFSGGSIDIGEAAAETLALALDPFPRCEGAEAALREAGVLEEGEAGPFAALKALKDKLAK